MIDNIIGCWREAQGYILINNILIINYLINYLILIINYYLII